MNKLSYGIAIIGSIALIAVLFLSSFQIVLYSNISFYEKEYSKYEVLDDVIMKMDDVLYVTQEMMDYLIDKRDNLNIDTIVDGKEREFFNQREKLHMADVKRLFLGGLFFRRICCGIILGVILLLVLLKSDLKRILPRAFQIATALVAVVTGVAAYYISNHFNLVFVQFHHIFFNNDLWLLNPETDLMINILPEGFFFDTVKSIGITFGILLGIFLCLSIIFDVINKRRNDSI